MVIGTLRTYFFGVDNSPHDIPNMHVKETGKVTDVSGTGIDYTIGQGKFGKHGKWFPICKPKTTDHVDYWYRRDTFEKHVLVEHTGMPKGKHGRTI